MNTNARLLKFTSNVSNKKTSDKLSLECVTYIGLASGSTRAALPTSIEQDL